MSENQNEVPLAERANNDDYKRKAKRYDRAIVLIQYHVQLLWLMFTAFLIAETVLLGAIAQIAKEQNNLAFGGSILGFLLVFPWWTTFRYNHAMYLLRISEAKSCEPEIGTFFLTGDELIKGNKITPKGMDPISIGCFSRFLNPKKAITVLIVAFAVSFLLIGILKWSRNSRQLNKVDLDFISGKIIFRERRQIHDGKQA